MERESRELNPGFITRMERGRPWVRREARGESRRPHGACRAARAAGSPARPRAADVQKLRARQLGGADRHRHRARGRSAARRARCPRRPRQPLRVVLDSQLRMPPAARVSRRRGSVLVLCTTDDAGRCAGAARSRRAKSSRRRRRWRRRSGGGARAAREREVNELLVEAGAASRARCSRRGSSTSSCSISRPRCSGPDSRPLVDLPTPKLDGRPPRVLDRGPPGRRRRPAASACARGAD